jgi:outer membrane protein, heavy metal efflux system
MSRLWSVVAFTVWLAASAHAQEAPTSEGLSLAQAIAVALGQEPTVRAARADVEIAQGMRIQAGLRPNPTTSFEIRQEPAATDSATSVGIEWPLDLFRRGARIAVADADVEVARHEEADIRRNLAGEVATAYGDVAAAVRQLAITDEILAAAARQLELLQARAAQGSTPTLERDMVDVDMRRLQADRVAQAGRMDRALLRLKRLLGMSAVAPLSLTQTLEELAPAADVAVNTAVDSSETRPDIQASETRIRAAEERVSAVRREGRPDVTVFGSYMYMDAGFPQRGFGTGGGLERVRGQFHYLAVGAMVTVPLWNRQQGSLAAATATREAAGARAESVRLTAASEIADARVRFDTARKGVSLYRDEIRPLARRNLDTIRETYQLGRATVFEVLAEQRRYLETERAFTEVLSDAFASRVSLDRSTGARR